MILDIFVFSKTMQKNMNKMVQTIEGMTLIMGRLLNLLMSSYPWLGASCPPHVAQALGETCFLLGSETWRMFPPFLRNMGHT